jgi:ribosomal protein S27AE
MKRKLIRSRPDLDEALATVHKREDSIDVRLALLRRRCPRCNSYLLKEFDRTFCLVCSWEHYSDGR